VSNTDGITIALITLNPNKGFSLVAYDETRIAFVEYMQPYQTTELRYTSKVCEPFIDPFGYEGYRLDFHTRDRELFLEKIEESAWASLEIYKEMVKVITTP
jgi:hypothetical protein